MQWYVLMHLNKTYYYKDNSSLRVNFCIAYSESEISQLNERD